MENKRILKIVWIISGIMLLVFNLNFLVDFYGNKGVESEIGRASVAPIIALTGGSIFHMLVGLVYILFTTKPSFIKKWIITGIILYLSVLIPYYYLSKSAGTEDAFYLGLGLAPFIVGGLFFLFIYLLFNLIYVMHMGIRLLIKSRKKS